MNLLAGEQIERWNRDGHLHVAGFLSAERAALLADWAADIASWPDSDTEWMHHREHTDDGIRLSRSENFMPYHLGMRALLTTGKLVEALGQLLGEPAVLYKEKINYKYPGGGGYAAHQDAPAYEFVSNHVTCLLAIDGATPENGCLYFASGLHHDGLIALDEHGCIDPAVSDTLTWTPQPLEPGDALFFSSYAPHFSPPNLTDQPRRALYLTYNAASEGDLHDAYYADKRASFATAGASHERISKIGHFRGRTATS